MSFDSTIFALALTFVCYEIAEALFRWSGRKAVFNPLLLAVLMIIGCLTLVEVDYKTYFAGTQFIHFLLGPATIALAVPLYEQRHRIWSAIVPILCATLAGTVTSILITVVCLYANDAGTLLIASFAPKSVTTPVAMAVGERLGGTGSLAATGVMLTGLCGAVTGPIVLSLASRIFGKLSEAGKGYALGMCAHGAGTARAFQDSNEAGAFAGVAIGLHALVAAIAIPIVLHLMGIH
ncbi:LrgB family protein [Bremerella cremea]|uniref:LrgB family protein n=1 Tax=Bremerella cremea TaxID=1031537 RepID=UPI0031EBD874